MLNRSKLWAAGLLFATFAVGLAVGGAVSAARGDDDGDFRGRRGRRTSYAERLQEDLALQPAQRESVKVILERRQTAMQELWREVAPRFDTLRTQIRGEIMGLLDEAQQARFQELIARSDSARAARGQGGRRGK